MFLAAVQASPSPSPAAGDAAANAFANGFLTILGGLFGAAAGSLLIGIIILLVLAILGAIYIIPMIITVWRLYSKAGQPGWAAIVPVYSQIVEAKVGQQPVWLGALTGLIGVVYYLQGKNGAFHSLLGLAGFVLGLYLLFQMAKRFDRGLGFWILFFLLPIVAVFMVGRAKYKKAR
jgi:hypothetical protein